MEFEDKTGFWRNPITGAVWQLSVEDGRLIVNVPNFSFQIFPSSPTEFRPVNTAVNLDIQFEKLDQNQRFLMHVLAKGIRRATFEAF